ncbi:MAG TPA: enoyl-CoA hydratase-related protein [Ramlibacter sp.]|jgi:2-(1,2-epoxy-1,2-dihydrophenyl)acetyl-CoA isomerase
MKASVLFTVQDGIATLTLNEGERMNPLTPELQEGCLAALQQVRDEKSIRALLLTARGRGFCVGADLADFSKRAAQPGAGSLGEYVGKMLEDSGNPIMAGLRSLPVPVVCAVNGVAAGGGVGLALACDMVIAARSAYFYLPFVPALGLVPDMGASWMLPRAVGRSRALGLALTGHKLGAEQAAAWGLIWACVDDDQLQAEAGKLAAQLAGLPAHAIEETRALFAASEGNDFTQQLTLERTRQQELIDGEAFAEGVRAFGERRKPVFRGRG